MSERNPDFHTGNWCGFYLENHRGEPGWMHMYLECDIAGKIKGEGIDYVGPWTLGGHFDAETKHCQWSKLYVGRHTVHYEGTLGEAGVQGNWKIQPYLTGNFHVWPEGMSHIHDEYLRMGTPLPKEQQDSIYEELGDRIGRDLVETTPDSDHI